MPKPVRRRGSFGQRPGRGATWTCFGNARSCVSRRRRSVIYASLSRTLKSDRHAERWLRSLELYAFPKFDKRPIQSMTSADVLAILNPIWAKKHDTARRVKQRIAAVFDWAKGAGHYPHENPVAGLKKALPAVKRKAEHMAAMPWRELPAFMAQLAAREAVSARCLEFLILTALRSGEVRGAEWSEFDLDDAVWLVPDARMKRGLPHRVPLSPAAVDVLNQVRGLDFDLVFPSHHLGPNCEARPQSMMVFKALLKRMGADGFEALRPSGWRDAEAAYLKDPTLTRDAAKGQISRTIPPAQARRTRSDLSRAYGGVSHHVSYDIWF